MLSSALNLWILTTNDQCYGPISLAHDTGKLLVRSCGNARGGQYKTPWPNLGAATFGLHQVLDLVHTSTRLGPMSSRHIVLMHMNNHGWAIPYPKPCNHMFSCLSIFSHMHVYPCIFLPLFLPNDLSPTTQLGPVTPVNMSQDMWVLFHPFPCSQTSTNYIYTTNRVLH